MDHVRQAFVARFNPVNPNISYIEYLVKQTQEGRREFFKWIRSKGRFNVTATQVNASEVIETSKKFGMISNGLLTLLQTKLSASQYNQLGDMIQEDDDQYYIDQFIEKGMTMPPSDSRQRVFQKLRALGYDIGTA